MIILEPETTRVASWTDPVLDVHLEQFAEDRRSVEALCPDENPEDLQPAYDGALRLCDSSRQIVFRLHRVSLNQIRKLIDEFQAAANVVAGWDLSKLESGRRELVHQFGEHIAKRAAFLQKQL